MSLVVRQFSASSDPGTFRLVVDVEGVEHVFVLTVNDGELTTVSGPESLHALCAAVGLPPSTLLRLPVRFRIDPPELPLSFQTPRRPQLVPEGELWRTSTRPLAQRRARVGAHLADESLEAARQFLAKHVDASFFPRAFEYRVVADAWDDLKGLAHDVDLLEHQVANQREMVVPKRDNVGARVATQLDILDTLLLTAAVFELGHVAERARVPMEQGVVHSFRFDSSQGSLWSAGSGYASFRQRVTELSEDQATSYVLEADISAFYHRAAPDVSVHALERAGCDRRLLEGIRRVLRSNSVAGLPVGPHFSSFFAEAVLNDVDATLLSAGAKFVRFNDDYRFFCASAGEAKLREQQFAEALWTNGKLTPQETKTKSFRVDEYIKRMRPEPTSWLEELALRLTELDPYGDVTSEQLEEPLRLRVEEARELLFLSIDPNREPNARLCRRAFAALPIAEKLDVIPQILEQLARVRLIAQDVSEAVHQGVPRHPDTNEELSVGLLQQLQAAVAFSRRNDFTRLWLCNAFVVQEMEHLPVLLEYCRQTPNDTPMLRESILALRGRLDGRVVDGNDSWLRRAQLVAGCELIQIRPASIHERWGALLEQAIVARRLDEELFIDPSLLPTE